MSQLPFFAISIAAFVLLLLMALLSRESVLATRQNFDQRILTTLFSDFRGDTAHSFHPYLIRRGENSILANTELLGLIRDRYAYLVVSDEEVVAAAIPATTDDGFNGTIDLLVAIDMFGRVHAARVLEDLDSNESYGSLDVIQSQWMENFSGSSMRDIQGISWQPIEDENEYDQFVGASITPRAVADRIYDALVFFQSNRIAFINSVN